MPNESQGHRLRGRANECATLRNLLSNVQAEHSQVLVLRGEAGIGKSALLDYLLERSSGFRCVQISGVESDMELAFAGLQQLCAPLMDYADELPEPQREALAVAFGRGVGPTPDRFLVGLAVLSLMAAAATSDQPLLCVVDDAQWLDQVSVQTLAFVARRLMAEPVAVVFAARDVGAEALAGLPELAIAGLSDADARALLDSVVLGRIDERVRDRIVVETRGIPLALLEVPRNLSAAELAGGFGNLGVRRTAGQIEDSFVHRIQALPADTRRLLLVAAAEPVGDAALFLRTAAHLGITVEALAPAEAAGMIEFGPRIRFHHPLVRSAAYRAADLTERRAIHQALADSTDPESDPDRRAWHAAIAAAGPDDAVAAELVASASRAQGRGGVAAAAAFLERAAILTADPALRGARAIAAARTKRDAAAPEAAYDLLGIAELAPLSELESAQVARLRAQLEFARARGGDVHAPPLRTAPPRLLDAAKRLERLDDFSARESYLEAFAAAMFAGRLGEPGALATTAEAARAALDRAPELTRPVDFLLHGWVQRINGDARAGSSHLRIALDHMRTQAQTNDTNVMRWMVPAFPILQESAAHELWDETIVQQLADTTVRRARDAGALAVLPQTLAYRAGAHLLAGEFTMAATLIEEANSITAATDSSSPVHYQAVLLAAWRGIPAEAVNMFGEAAAVAAARGEGRLLGLTKYAAAVLYNGLGRYEEACACAREACEYEDVGFYGSCLFELVEAAVHAGERDTATQAVQQLGERAGAGGTDWGLGALLSSQALVADDDLIDDLFTEAVERLERTRVVVHLARTRLRYGEWLRRMNRRLDARRQLTEAFELFTRMGSQGFAERTRRELVATGEKTRKQPVSSGDALTTQEAQIARLAADGLTNQEIGSQLFISTHTVEWHLRKVFVKLGISSRRQLRTVSWAS